MSEDKETPTCLHRELVVEIFTALFRMSTQEARIKPLRNTTNYSASCSL